MTETGDLVQKAYLETQAAYESSAAKLVSYWAATGTRERHIKLIMKLSGVKGPKILELGCGPGRDAPFMVEVASEYIGIDYSKSLIEIAKVKAPKAKFKVGDMVKVDYPKNVDIIVAFASIIHLNDAQLKQVFGKARKSLNKDGIFYISAKNGHGTSVKNDEFGERTYYHYTAEAIKKLAGPNFKVELEEVEVIRNQEWTEIALRKIA